MSTSALKNCYINEFDAPSIKSIIVDFDKYSSKNSTFAVGKKNFPDSLQENPYNSIL